MDKIIYIMRGLPGSGKSTCAKLLQANPLLICSADNYHINQHGFYDWKQENQGRAHRTCQLYANLLAQQGFSPIVIDNTNIKRKDFKVYHDIAAMHGYQVIETTSTAEWAWDVDKCAEKNTHNVPKEVIQRMKDQYEQ